jgi:hypothetical protein
MYIIRPFPAKAYERVFTCFNIVILSGHCVCKATRKSKECLNLLDDQVHINILLAIQHHVLFALSTAQTAMLKAAESLDRYVPTHNKCLCRDMSTYFMSAGCIWVMTFVTMKSWALL